MSNGRDRTVYRGDDGKWWQKAEVCATRSRQRISARTCCTANRFRSWDPSVARTMIPLSRALRLLVLRGQRPQGLRQMLF